VAVAEALGKALPVGDQVKAWGRRLLNWFAQSILRAPVQLLVPCVLGGAVLVALLEAAIRRLFRRPAAMAPST
jgi:hypothetical protein